MSTALVLSTLATGVAAQTRAELANLVFDVELLVNAPQDEASSENSAAPSSAPNTSEAAASPQGESESAGDELLLAERDPRDLQQEIDRYRASIAELSRSAETPYSEALREQNYSLALLLSETGDREGAIAALESAMHIDRVNHGLFTPRQVDLVNQLIQNHDQLGNYDQVADYEEYLFYIQTKSYAEDDPRYIAATERWADWNVESFLKTGPEYRMGDALSYSTSTSGGPGYVAVQSANGMVYFVPRDRISMMRSPGMPGSLTDPGSSPYALTPEMMVDQRLRRAKDIYEELQENDSVSPEHKADLQRKQANIAFTLKRQMDAMTAASRSSFGFNGLASAPINPVVSRGYQENLKPLETVAQELEADPNASPEAKATAYLDLGDWHLSFERFRPATEAYSKAWELIGAPTDPAPTLHPLLHAEYLMPVPSFAQHPYSRELNGIDPNAELEYKGFVDVSLGIDRRGRVTRQRIIDSSEGTSQVLRNAILDYLRESRMRPFIQNGEPTDVSGLTLRFRYIY